MGRPSRFPAQPGGGAPASHVWRSLFFWLLAAFFFWLFDAGFALKAGGGLNGARAQGLLAGLGLGMLVAAVAGLVLGSLAWLAAPARRAERAWEWLREPDQALQFARVAAVLAWIPVFGLYAGAAFEASRRLIIGMARPHFAAIAIVAAQLAIALFCLWLHPAFERPSVWLARKLGGLPGLRWLFGRVLGLLAVLSAFLVAAAVAVVVVFWRIFEFLPWRPIGVGAGALVCAALCRMVATRFARTGLVMRALLAAVFATAIIALLALDPYGERAKHAVQETLAGRFGYSAALFALDFDRDGYLGMFGGGDCAPFDPRISPGAVDVPNNGKDEDCDGADLDAKRLEVERKRDWPVPEEFPTRPPIVLITVDTFAAGRMQALGYKRKITPNIDAYAERSAFFRYCFAQGPSTRLSFPSLFTSRWDSQIKQRLIGSHPYPIDDSELMLAEVLTTEGYDTAAVLPDAYFRKNRWGSLTAGFRQVNDGPSRSSASHNSAEVTDAALAIYRQPHKHPLFLWVHYYDAHSPHEQPAEIERFGKRHSDVYDAELKLVDREVGRLLDALEHEPGEQPLVLLTGDHGIAFDAPRHETLNYGYDLTSVVLHVPLIVHGPMVKTQRSDHIVSTMDIAPTITNLLRVKRSLPFEGASLVPELLEGRHTRPERLVHEFYLEEKLWDDADPLVLISLRTERYNLVHDRSTGSYELYDWRKDYYERHNLADAPEQRAAFLGLKRQLAFFTYKLYDREHSRAAQVSFLTAPAR